MTECIWALLTGTDLYNTRVFIDEEDSLFWKALSQGSLLF